MQVCEAIFEARIKRPIRFRFSSAISLAQIDMRWLIV